MNSVLESMLRGMESAPAVYGPSPFWKELVATNLRSLAGGGYDNFKRSLSQNYFNFVVKSPWDVQFRQVLKDWCLRPSLRHLRSEWGGDQFIEVWGKPTRFNRIHAFSYRTYVSLLQAYVERRDPERLLERIQEPDQGNPLKIILDGKRISQDLCNSVLEYYSFRPHLGEGMPVIGELGAGYGRLGFVLLSAIPCRYVVFDIPPALFVAQTYLEQVFPGSRIFRYRQFTGYEEIKEEYEASDLAFLLPHQMELLPDDSFDLMINISSLQEMTRSQVGRYLEIIGRLSRGLFYSKQWVRVVDTTEPPIRTWDEYPIPKSWKRLFLRRHEIQRSFQEALYQVV